ncbi:MAG: DUF4233 domain-containing protein [Actinobacteria bacterium]|nr:DUF4233 domain-containing protein [Actinomycetota bacterium]
MRTVGSAVLVLEWIVVGLALIVANNVSGVPGQVVLTVLAIMTVLMLAAMMTLPERAGVALGWTVQVLMLAMALWVPLMAVLGVLFLGLWYLAVRLGRQVDDAKKARANIDLTDGEQVQPAHRSDD